jgi:hypothetical protein
VTGTDLYPFFMSSSRSAGFCEMFRSSKGIPC